MTWLRSTLARWREGDDGLSLVELVVAMFILSVGLMAVASTAITSLVSLRQSRERQQATDAASAVIEQARSVPYEELALDETDGDVAALGGCFDPGTGVAADLVLVDPLATGTTPFPFETTAGVGNGITLQAYITWNDDECGTLVEVRTAKRVTVIATYEDAGEVRRVRQSTVVAPVDRGLPLPDFRLFPRASTLTFAPDQIDQSTDPARCLSNTLANRGAADSYDWELAVGIGATAQPALLVDGVATYRGTSGTAADGFDVVAYFEYPPLGDQATNPPPNPLPAGIIRMEDDADADTRPQADDAPGSPVRVAPSDAAFVTVCYQPRGTHAYSLGDSFDFTVTVHSRFDPNRTESVTHTVTVADPTITFHMRRPDRRDPCKAINPRAANSVYRMEENPSGLDCIHDWDKNLDPEDQVGTSPIAGDRRYDLVWGGQFNPGVTIQPSVRLRFHSHVPAARDVRFRVELERRDASENAVAGGVFYVSSATTLPVAVSGATVDAGSGDIVVTHAAGGSVPVVVDLPLSGDVTFADGEYLWVRLGCVSGPCHVLYDTITYDTQVTVTKR